MRKESEGDEDEDDDKKKKFGWEGRGIEEGDKQIENSGEKRVIE